MLLYVLLVTTLEVVEGEIVTIGEQRIDELPVDQLPPQALVACMGAQACKRVCSALDGTMSALSQLEGALPYEYDCNTLAPESEIVMPDVFRRELAEAVSMPNLTFLGVEATALEAEAYLIYLHKHQEKFESYTKSLLLGASLPRAAADLAAEEWRTDEYTSPYAEKLASLTEDEQAEASSFHALLRGFHDLAMLKKHGLLFDASMEAIIEKAAAEISVGHHIKLSSEPGVAKSSLAKYLGNLNARAHHPDWTDEQCEHILISMHSTKEAEAQVSEQTFEDNTLGERLSFIAIAMQKGRAIVLDEQNGMTADQQVFFNDMLLKKPGETVRVGDTMITIKPGFTVIATINPLTDTQGNRRHGRQQEDSASSARYTRIDMKYPGQKAYIGNPKETLNRLFYSQYVDMYGWHLPTAEVIKTLDNCQEYLTKLAKMATEAPADGTNTGVLITAQTRPELAECISPRDFVRILESTMLPTDLKSLPNKLRKAITVKTNQILESDNGHYVTPAAKQAVNQLLRTNGFTPYA
jgi:hypothetical protein